MATPITVLMTVYNNEKYIRWTLESILAQSFTDFDFLIIDDASQDQSVSIIREFADPRIRLVVQEKNCGQTASLNRGLQMAKGEYIARIDADDIALPTRLEKQLAFARAQGKTLGAIGTPFTFIDAQGKTIFSPKLSQSQGDMIWHLLFTSPIAHPSALIKKEAILQAGGYDPAFRYVQDQILWTRMLKKGFQIFNLEGEPLTCVRLHPDSATQKGKEAREQEAIIALQETMRSLLSLDIDSESAKNFYQFLMGFASPDKATQENAIGWLRKCRAKNLPCGRTLLRLALFGKNLSLFRRFLFLVAALKENGLGVVTGNGNFFQGVRYFISLRRTAF